MQPITSARVDWDARISRATELIEHYPAAAQLLLFYRNVAGFQRTVYEQVLQQAKADVQRPLRGQLNQELLAPFFPELLRLVEEHGPAQLVESARALRTAGESKWREKLMDHIAGLEPASGMDEFFARACVEPYAEHLGSQIATRHSQTAGTCPVCTGKPMLGVLRPEGEGARRSLVCSFCLTEWDFRRLLCPACGEESERNLPVYTTEGLPHIRVESCDSCRHYLLSVDMSRNGFAVPLVDEIAAAPLDLWAGEKGYQKIAPNLLGL
ncbi:MAG: formate dehydrogenase accessory protein FdhE [Acidobacteriia bacterium]|nr:formate dehydrogenase accessory protein FdhE [Terriglobia bacterium]